MSRISVRTAWFVLIAGFAVTLTACTGSPMTASPSRIGGPASVRTTDPPTAAPSDPPSSSAPPSPSSTEPASPSPVASPSPSAAPRPPAPVGSPSTWGVASPAVVTLPGNGLAWHPIGVAVAGSAAVYVTSRGTAGLAYLDMHRLKVTLVGGMTDPPGAAGFPWGGMVPAAQRPSLVAAFNAGFKWSDMVGGWLSTGKQIGTLHPGVASVIVYTDGTATVGIWGRDAGMGPNIVGVRQNLSLLVDGAAPTAAAVGGSQLSWGKTIGGVLYTWRSALGVTADGNLVYVGGNGLSPANLAADLVAAGAVRGMQLDINQSWVSFNVYGPTASGAVAGQKVYGAPGRPNNRYLSADNRDFFAVQAR